MSHSATSNRLASTSIVSLTTRNFTYDAVTCVNTAAPQLLMVHADHLGRPVRLTDAARTTVWSAAYDPFGQPWQVTGPVEQNLRFPGQYFLLESGLSYNWHRFYDPATGRYTQPDPLRFVDGPSVYGYVSASPMMRVDPEGLSEGDSGGVFDALSVLRIPHAPHPPLAPSPRQMCDAPNGLVKNCHEFCTDKCVGRGLGSDAPFCYWNCMRECESF